MKILTLLACLFILTGCVTITNEAPVTNEKDAGEVAIPPPEKETVADEQPLETEIRLILKQYNVTDLPDFATWIIKNEQSYRTVVVINADTSSVIKVILDTVNDQRVLRLVMINNRVVYRNF